MDLSLDDLKEIAEEFFLFSDKKITAHSHLKKDFFINKSFYTSKSVTFFGGSFNPLHEGHLECIRLCPETNIVIVPDRNPLKELVDRDVVSELSSLVNAFKDLNVSIYPGFFIKNEKNPTSKWLVKVRRDEINFLMGDDSFMSLFKWINPEVILKTLTKIYVVPRNFKRSECEEQLAEVLKINPKLKVIFLSEHPYQNLNSTDLRK